MLDLTHGAEVLAEAYLQRGDEVTLVDVYRTAPAVLKKRLREQGARVLLASPDESFDLLVAPIHCPDRYIGKARFSERLTHHRAVGQLARFKVPGIEVTGVGAKTSTVHLLGHLLHSSGDRVLLLSSRGVFLMDEEGTRALEPRSSIAPASVLRMSRLDLGQDVVVMEVSLGGTGCADVGVITSLSNDYPIAQGTRRAWDGKRQMLALMKKGAAAVFPAHEGDIWRPDLPERARALTFGRGGDVELLLPESLRLGSPMHAAFRTPQLLYGFSMPGDFLGAAYATALQAAFAAYMALGRDPDLATEALESFHGVPGRGEISSRPGGWTVLERNPGVSAPSVDWMLEVLERDYGAEDVGVAIDPVSVKVCEKLDLARIKDVAGRHPGVKGLYLSELAPGLYPGYELTPSQKDAESRHRVLLWCTKEGYV